MQALREERGREFRTGHYLWVQRRGETVRVDLDLVDWVRAEGEYVRLHVGRDNYLHASRSDRSCNSSMPRASCASTGPTSSIATGLRQCAAANTGGYKIMLGAELELPVGRSYRASVRSIAVNGAAARAN